ncbi:MAG: ArsR/SmtB family transcription factor [Pirellulaceae bacterium]
MGTKAAARVAEPGTSETSTSKPRGHVSDFAEAAECLKTLAHPVRLRVVQMLLHGRYTVGELAEDSQVPNNAMSDHLRLLQRCGFLTSERDGRRVYYQVAEPHLEQLMACIEGRFIPRGTQ